MSNPNERQIRPQNQDLPQNIGEQALSKAVYSVIADLSFIRAFDGTQPFDTKEMFVAAHLLKRGIEDIFLQHVGSVKEMHSLFPEEQGKEVMLELIKPLDAKTKVDIQISSFEAISDNSDIYELTLSHKRRNIDDYDQVPKSMLIADTFYSLKRDCDEVVRWELGEIEHDAATRMETSGLTPAENEAYWREKRLNDIGSTEWTLQDEHADAEALREAGVNYMPVGVAEVEALLALINQADIKDTLF